jgi:hypothetical protein
MKTKNIVPRREALSSPHPTENNRSTDPQERTLTKDEQIDLLRKACEESVSLIGDFNLKAVPVLLFLREGLQDEDGGTVLVLHTRDGDIEYCQTGQAVGEICNWLATELHECWNKIDASRMGIPRPNPKFQD